MVQGHCWRMSVLGVMFPYYFPCFQPLMLTLQAAGNLCCTQLVVLAFLRRDKEIVAIGLVWMPNSISSVERMYGKALWTESQRFYSCFFPNRYINFITLQDVPRYPKLQASQFCMLEFGLPLCEKSVLPSVNTIVLLEAFEGICSPENYCSP